VSDRPGQAVVKFHKLGTDPAKDPIIHEKTGDPTKFIGADVSRDGKYIFFSQSNGWDKNDVWYQTLHGVPTAAIAHAWKPIVVGKPFLYSLDAWKGEGYITTNEDEPGQADARALEGDRAAIADRRAAGWGHCGQSPRAVVAGQRDQQGGHLRPGRQAGAASGGAGDWLDRGGG
jgi:hypothetical protein